MFELNQQVAIKDWGNYYSGWGNYYSGTITGETPKFWKVTFDGQEEKFYKEPRNKWASDKHCEMYGDYTYKMFVLTDELQAEIDRTTAERAELRAIGDAKRAERNAFKEAEKAWRLTPDGIAQTARENDLEGLEIVSDIDKRDDGTIYATFSLVGQQQDNHVSEIRPKYRYARVEVGRRVDRDWETGAITCRKPTISCSSLNDSLGYVRNMQRLISAAIEYAETL